MKGKKLLILLGALIIALGIAYELSTRPSSTELRRRRRQVFPELEPRDVASLAIRTPDSTYVCRRTGRDRNRWELTRPVRLRADSRAVTRIIQQLCGAEKQGTARGRGKAQKDLAVYGLESPARTLTLRSSGPDAREWRLLLGKPTDVAGGVWARLAEGQEIFSLPGDIAEGADVTLADLRSKKLTPDIPMGRLKALQFRVRGLKTGDTRDVACKKKRGRWEITAPVHDLADQNVISTLLKRVTEHTLQKKDFVTLDPDNSNTSSKYGLDSPYLRLSFMLAGGQTTLLIGKKTEDGSRRYARLTGEPGIVAIPNALAQKLAVETADLRQPALLAAPAEDVRCISLSGVAVTLLAPVLFEFRGRVEFRRVDGDDFQLGTTGATVDDLSDFEVVVQVDAGTAFRTICF